MSEAELIPAEQSGQLVYITDWEVDYPDPDDFIVPFASSGGSVAHRVSYVDANVTAVVNQETMTVDPAQRIKLISQIEHMVNNDYAYLWLYYEDELSVSRTWLQERANATLASHISSYNSASTGENPYYYEITKGPPTMPLQVIPSGELGLTQSFISEAKSAAVIPISVRKNF